MDSCVRLQACLHDGFSFTTQPEEIFQIPELEISTFFGFERDSKE